MSDQLFSATLSLLADGAYIEQTATAPIAYRLIHERNAVAIPGSIVQRLQTSQKLRESAAQVNGRKRLYLAENRNLAK